jgi:hypothetical protein
MSRCRLKYRTLSSISTLKLTKAVQYGYLNHLFRVGGSTSLTVPDGDSDERRAMSRCSRMARLDAGPIGSAIQCRIVGAQGFREGYPPPHPTCDQGAATKSIRGSRRRISLGRFYACAPYCPKYPLTQKEDEKPLTPVTTRAVLMRTHIGPQAWNGSPLCGSDRGSWAGRFREGRLRRVLSKAPTEFGRTPLLPYGAAFHGILVVARPQPAGQGARQGDGEDRPRSETRCFGPGPLKGGQSK